MIVYERTKSRVIDDNIPGGRVMNVDGDAMTNVVVEFLKFAVCKG